MTQYNFTTNIEKRMPTTGEVFFVDRMTSDYAEQQPFDVDAFIESVFQKYEQMAQEDAYARAMGWNETREALRRHWDATLGERNPRGNAALYPNKNGEKHPALMEVWHKAGDYWRRGLRLGDVLPAVVPPCKITRTEDGWIALFPKDMYLLEQQADQPAKPKTEATAPAVEPTEPAEQEQPEVCPAVFPQEQDEPQEQQTADPTPTPPLEREGNGCASRPCQRRNQELQAIVERELQRQLHPGRDIDRHTDESEQPATAGRNRGAGCKKFFTLHSIPAYAPTRSLSFFISEVAGPRCSLGCGLHRHLRDGAAHPDGTDRTGHERTDEVSSRTRRN